MFFRRKKKFDRYFAYFLIFWGVAKPQVCVPPSDLSLEMTPIFLSILVKSSATVKRLYTSTPCDDRRVTTDVRRPTFDDRRQTTDVRRPTCDDRRPTTDDRRLTTDDRRPTTDITDERRPMSDDRRVTTDDVRPTIYDRRPKGCK